MATKDTYIYGLGRRKAATARVRLYSGKGEITINDKPALEGAEVSRSYRIPSGDACGKVSRRLYDAIRGIQNGEIEDRHGWCVLL